MPVVVGGGPPGWPVGGPKVESTPERTTSHKSVGGPGPRLPDAPASAAWRPRSGNSMSRFSVLDAVNGARRKP